MKKILKVLGIILFSVFLLVPLKTNAQEADWIQKLELGDSVSSSIVKVEDGVIVMQYEGAASTNNLLIKYDFDGNKVWEISNDYGYNIESVSDGFIVWSEEKITKFDKDKHIIWSKNVELKRPTSINNEYELGNDVVAGLGNKLIELDNNYIIIQTQAVSNPHNDIFSFSFDGELIERIASDDMFRKHILLDDYRIIGVGNSPDKNTFFILYDDGANSGVTEVYITHYDKNFSPVKTYTYDVPSIDYPLNAMDWVSGVIKMVETEDNYLAIGRTTISFSKENKFKIYKKMILDIDYIDGNLYAYEIIDSKEDNSLAQATIVKYDENLKELERINLPFYFPNEINDIFRYYYYNSGFSQIKNRIVFNSDDNKAINAVTLNTPIVQMYRGEHSNEYTIKDIVTNSNYETDINSYSLSSFKFKIADENEESTDNNNTISGIINNITKNPQTNSIIIISVFMIIILAISIVSYIMYSKKNNKKGK